MKMVKGLTKANISKYGIEVAPQYDFNDDGSNFRGFIYKGMPMTQCRADGECYLTIRVDYLNTNFTYNEWMDTKEWKLCQEFNGVNEFDIEKLIENLERVIAKVKEMNTYAEVNMDDLELVKDTLKTEIYDIRNFLDNTKSSFEWWNVKPGKESYVKYIIEEFHKLQDCVARGYKTLRDLDTMSIHDQKTWIEQAKRVSENGKYTLLSYRWNIKYAEDYIKACSK